MKMKSSLKPVNTFDSPRVLIVEDDGDFAKTLKMLLENKFKADVRLALDCSSAREAFSASAFDLITLDQLLPDGNGLELLKEIMKQGEHPPVLMVTGNGNEGVAAESSLQGSSGYIVKDKDIFTLLPAAVKRTLDSAKMEQLLEESEIRYRRLFEAARDGILILDAEDGTITDVNPYLEKSFGNWALSRTRSLRSRHFPS
jgi:DNA-binding NtrC family response regulator